MRRKRFLEGVERLEEGEMRLEAEEVDHVSAGAAAETVKASCLWEDDE
jgi:hypothetical protein